MTRLAARTLVISILCILALVLPVSADSLSVSQFRQLAPRTGEFQIEGYIAKRFRCPACPNAAQCKPCIGNSVLVSQDDEVLQSYPSEGNYLVVFTDVPERLEVSKFYRFNVKVLEARSTGHGVQDLKLISALELGNQRR